MRYLILAAVLLSTHNMFAQRQSGNRYLEAGMMLGLTNYTGDVSEKFVQISETRPGVGIFVRYHFSSSFALKTTLYTGNISGTDLHAKNPELRARSFRFKSNLLELALLGEWNFLNIKPTQKNGLRTSRIVPYITFGIGGVQMHPRVEYFGPPDEFNDHVLYSLPEDGLSKTALVVPLGGGLRSQITEQITLGLEGSWHPVLSDYLDGVSLNGNPDSKDWFYTGTVSVCFAFAR